jgi:hypothetical protein
MLPAGYYGNLFSAETWCADYQLRAQELTDARKQLLARERRIFCFTDAGRGPTSVGGPVVHDEIVLATCSGSAEAAAVPLKLLREDQLLS